MMISQINQASDSVPQTHLYIRALLKPVHLELLRAFHFHRLHLSLRDVRNRSAAGGLGRAQSRCNAVTQDAWRVIWSL